MMSHFLGLFFFLIFNCFSEEHFEIQPLNSYIHHVEYLCFYCELKFYEETTTMLKAE